MIHLKAPDGIPKTESAAVLVIRRGGQCVLGGDYSLIKAEHDCLDMDKKALMRGRVVNKRARWNLCFAEEAQEPDYEKGKGRIVAWNTIPLTGKIREKIKEWTGDVEVYGEANYYYDNSRCGIGFHGDAERRKVFALRIGDSMPLIFRWFYKSLQVGDPLTIDLRDGDMYVMSDKAVGNDWLKKNTPTLRHATGCALFTTIK
jgi:hypothetical protein